MYRILTERKNADQVKNLLVASGLDYTIFYGDGSWHGAAEYSMAIELDNIPRIVAESVAQIIKFINGQAAILIQEIPTSGVLL
jgi:hypothetical protein